MEMNDLPRNVLPRLVNLPHPLVDEGRQVSYLPFSRNETLGGYVRRAGIEVASGPLAVQVNGQPVPDWRRYRLKQGDHITIRAAVRGGGGNGGKVLRVVAMIVLVIVANVYGAQAGAAMGLTGATAASVGAAVIMIGGSLLINALLPPPTPDIGGLSSGSATETSPTYALNGGRNRARKFEPMPLVIGQHRIVPDAASLPYTQYVGDDQYLYQAFHFGLQADLTLSEFRIGDTGLEAYAEVTKEEAGADGQLALLAGNVDTLAGFDLRSADGWAQRTSSIDAVRIEVELAGVLYYAQDNGTVSGQSATVELEFRAVGSTVWQPLEGANSAITVTGSGTKPVRRTVSRDVPRGQYELRMRKTTGDTTSSRASNSITVAQIRSFQADDTDYTGQRRVALKLRATAQLNGAIDEMSALATAQCPVWTGSAWVTQATTNPAWWYLWFARGKFDAAGRRVYGGGLPDSRIDLEAIKAWGAWCDANSLTVSMVLDRSGSTADVLNRVARCGRGSMTWQTGRLGVVWDAADLPVVAVFGPANIAAGSFEVSYIGEQTADEVIVNFVNRNTWEADQVRKTVPGVVNPSSPVTLDFIGCTDPEMAGREANLIAASQIHHRRRVSWETDVEGMVATRGDVVLLSHDMASWSYSGRLLGGSRSALTLDRVVPLGSSAWVGIRFPDGRYATYRVEAGAGESDIIQLADLIPAEDGGGPLPVPDEGGAVAVDWLWFYDPATTPGRRVKIVDVQPSGDNVRFTAIDDVPAYYASENGDFQGGTAVESYLPPVVGYLNLSESSRVTADGRRLAVLLAHWAPLAGATHYLFRYRRAGGAWTEISVPDTDTELDVEPGIYEAQVAAVFRSSRSAAAVASITIQGNTVTPAAAPIFTATGEAMQIALRWSWPEVAGMSEARLYARTGSNPMALLVPLAYPQESWTHLGLATGVTVDYELRLVDSWGNVSEAKTASATTVKDPSVLLEQLEGSVSNEALTEELRAPIERVPVIEGEIIPAIELRATDIETRATAIESIATLAVDAAALAGESALGLLAKLDGALDQLRREGAITDATVEVDPVTGQIRLIAEAQITTDVEARLNQLGFELDAISGTITATNLQVTDHAGRITAAESTITQLSDQITQKVDAVYVDSKLAGVDAAALDNGAALDALGEAALKGVLADDAVRDLVRNNRATIAQAQRDLQATADDLAAEATDRLQLAALLDQQAAALVQESTARATKDEALTQQVTTLQATSAGNTAAVQSEATARADADAALGQRVDTVVSRADATEAGLQSEQTARADADEALGQRIDTVQATAAGNTAAIQLEQSARADADSALGARIDTVQAEVDDNTAAIQLEQQARADGDAAVASSVTTLQSEVAGNGDAIDALGEAALKGVINDDAAREKLRVSAAIASQKLATLATDQAAQADYALQLAAQLVEQAASLLQEATTRADAVSALSKLITTLQAQSSDNAAAIQQESTARADGVAAVAEDVATLQTTVAGKADGATVTALSQRVDTVESGLDGKASTSSVQTLQTTVNGNTASIQTHATSIDGLKSQYTLKVGAGGKLASWGAYADANGSAFDYLADRFSVSKPDGTGSRQVFTVGSINGAPVVGISGDLVLDGAMTARHISAEAAEFVLLQAKSAWADNAYIGSLSELSNNLGITVKGKLQNHADAAQATAFIDLDATGSAAFLSVKQAGIETIRVQANGYAAFARQVISAPDVVASGELVVDSGWLASGVGYTVIIDTGFTVSGNWWAASQDMYLGSATISSGESMNGGGNGYSSAEVLIGDGLLSGSANSPADNRIYLRFVHSRIGGGSIRITKINWKLARV